MEHLYPMELIPAYKDYLWGGRRLEALYGKGGGAARTAESWELSCLPQGLSTIKNGAYAGETLAAVLGDAAADFPVLVKLIDAAQNLSVQVHPSDETADAARGERGKAELWVVVDCDADGSLYYGLSEDVSARTLRESAQDGSITRLLNRVAVRPGDVFFVTPGTIHALGAGVVVAEVQQSSDTTFRLYDYGRLGADGQPRALHLERGCAVADRHATPPEPCAPLAREDYDGWTRTRLFACPYFRAERLDVQGAAPLDVGEGFVHLLFWEGRGKITHNGTDYPFTPGSSWYLPAGLGIIRVEGACSALLTRT